MTDKKLERMRESIEELEVSKALKDEMLEVLNEVPEKCLNCEKEGCLILSFEVKRKMRKKNEDNKRTSSKRCREEDKDL